MKYEFCVARKSLLTNEYHRVGNVRQTLSSAIRDKVKYERIYNQDDLFIMKREVKEWRKA